ncbi:MAG: hypothetical protein CBC35_11190 [Planctomycetes bacterium TMED75]|nr:hypothetical protein [Planctomycetaceae bacterium]OUU90715.1 MAG: hypothetical protein CBC35_11190 [Planctomycetes bacterium TMED75]
MVIGIIVILIGLLLPALGRASSKARRTQTQTTLNEFMKSCEAFYQEFGFYPGVVSDEELAENPMMSGTQNALLHLMGGAMRRSDVTDAVWNDFQSNSAGAAAQVVSFSSGDVAFRPDLIGRGPFLRGKQYPPFYNPKENELKLDLDSSGNTFLVDQGSIEVGGNALPLRQALPTLLDAWDAPVLYARQIRTTGPLVCPTTVSNYRPQFSAEVFSTVTGYNSLGERGGRQETLSIIHPDGPNTGIPYYPAHIAQYIRSPTLGPWDSTNPTENSALGGVPRGSILIWSAGEDNIFLSKHDGPGSPGDPQDNLFEEQYFNPKVTDEYDDVIVFGGS